MNERRMSPPYRSPGEIATPSPRLFEVIHERAREVPSIGGYVVNRNGLYHFGRDYIAPLAKAINCAIPGGAFFAHDLPIRTIRQIRPYVGRLFQYIVRRSGCTFSVADPS